MEMCQCIREGEVMYRVRHTRQAKAMCQCTRGEGRFICAQHKGGNSDIGSEIEGSKQKREFMSYKKHVMSYKKHVARFFGHQGNTKITCHCNFGHT